MVTLAITNVEVIITSWDDKQYMLVNYYYVAH